MSMVVNVWAQRGHSLNKTPPTDSPCACSSAIIFYHAQAHGIMQSSNHNLHHGHPDFRTLPLRVLLLLSPLCPTVLPLNPRGKDPMSSLPLIYRAWTQGGRSLIPSEWLCGHGGEWQRHGRTKQPPTVCTMRPHRTEKRHDPVSGKSL